jgi:hypothetical protein
MKNLFCRNEKFVIKKLKICYSSQQMLQNPAAILNALRKSCKKIAFLSPEFIFTVFLRGQQHRKLHSWFNFTNKYSNGFKRQIQTAQLIKNSKLDTCTNELLFLSQRPILSPPYIFTFPLVSPCISIQYLL